MTIKERLDRLEGMPRIEGGEVEIYSLGVGSGNK